MLRELKRYRVSIHSSPEFTLSFLWMKLIEMGLKLVEWNKNIITVILANLKADWKNLNFWVFERSRLRFKLEERVKVSFGFICFSFHWFQLNSRIVERNSISINSRKRKANWKAKLKRGIPAWEMELNDWFVGIAALF